MDRKNALITVGVSTACLSLVTVAGVALTNTMLRTSPAQEKQTTSLVAAAPTATAVSPSPDIPQVGGTELLPPPDLTVLQTPVTVPAANDPVIQEVPAEQTMPATKTQAPKQTTPSQQPETQPIVEQPVPQITATDAQAIVLQSLGNGKILNTDSAKDNGYDVWKVKVQRQDGSVVTGYVEKTSGVIYNWEVNQPAPPRTVPVTSTTQNQNTERESEHEEENERHEDSHEDEHEGDDD